jgi:hypothetical protein
VKDILRLPILLLFVFVLLFLSFSVLEVLAVWGSVYSEGREAALRVAGADINRGLVQALPAAVLAALMILLARIAFKPGSRFLSLLVPLGGAFLLLAVGYQLLEGLGTQEADRPAPSARRYLMPGVFNATENKAVYLEDLDDSRAVPVVVAEGGDTGQRLLYFPQGRVVAGEDTVILRMAGYTLETDANPVFGGLFAAGETLRGLFADLDFLNAELADMFRASLPSFYFAVLAVVLSFYGAGMFFRLSRWRLLNVVLVLLALRGILALFRFMRVGVVLELNRTLHNPQIAQLLPEMVLVILGGLLLLLDLLFVPFGAGAEEE